jgi:hypothetical protein
MNDKSDLDRARELGMTIEQFQKLAGSDPRDAYPELTRGSSSIYGPKGNTKGPTDNKKKKKKKDADAGLGGDNLEDIGEKLMTFETDTDVRNKDAGENEHAWDRPVETPADKALYYGFHTHTKDNMYGLHAHYPGGPLGGGHLHSPQNPLGYHTHRYDIEQLLQFKFARPGIMIELDGPHVHQANAPDGKHIHSEENFGPADSDRAQDVADRNAQVDKNIVSALPKDKINLREDLIRE